MEWVETTGRTLAEAVDAALDQLGVHEDEAEVEVLSEGKAGIIGRLGAREARVRARIKPISREKRHRRGGGRDRDKGRDKDRGKDRGKGKGGGPAGSAPDHKSRTRAGRSGAARADKAGSEPRRRGRSETGGGAQEPREGEEGPRGTRRRRRARPEPDTGTRNGNERGVDMTVEMSVDEQAAIAEEFVRGLLAAFGKSAALDMAVEDDIVSIRVEGDDLGVLVGPRGSTLQSIEELTRTVVQRQAGRGARIRVDIGGYQAKRREALAEFTRRLARGVAETGKPQALEPMNAPDRKVVHDAAAEIEGVETVSDGEEPRRRVVIRKA